MTDRPSAFSPLAHRTFRWLWIALTVSTVGVWMQALGAQWFLVTIPGGGAIVALVQTALTLPMALLAMPAGVLADSFNRRWLLIIVQSGVFLVSLVLTALTAVGVLIPPTLLVLMAVLGCGSALTLTPFNSLIPELVSRDQIPSSAALVGVAANLARIIGPALAGVLVAYVGFTAVFALSAATAAFFVVVLLRWNGTRERVVQRERFWPAMKSGVRYVRHSPQVLKLMLRSFWFTAPMMAIFALLPLIATERLGMGSSGYGVLFGVLGAGAVAGGISLTRIRRTMTTNAIVAMAVVGAAVVLAVLPFITVAPVTMALLLLAGASWTLTNAALGAALQIYLPAWVRARGLSLQSMALFGGQGLGSLAVGFAANTWGLTVAFIGSGVVLALSGTMAIWLPLRELEGIDRTPTQHWPDPNLILDPEEMGGEVVVMLTYWIDPEDEAEFIARMENVRRIRLRTGGNDWKLVKDGEVPRRFVEEYSVSSWEEHEYQHHSRLVASDQEVEEAVNALSDPAPEVAHLFSVEVRSGWR